MNRVFDIFLSGFGILVCFPVIVALVPIVRFTSHGPALFHQRRVGRNKEIFFCHKIRTMAIGTPQVGTHEILESSVTGIGRFLRRTKLDEIPQLWNVFTGEMSLVGPRPCLPSQSELIREREERGVFALRPGITGLGQIRGIDMSDPVRLAECDAEYAEARSFIFDLKLIWHTLSGAGMGDRINIAGVVSEGSDQNENTKKDIP
jgi:O-antigen biosynthesis protein WbqP